MRLVRRLSLRQKLFGSFGFVLVLLVALIAVSLTGMRSLSAATHDITGNADPKLVTALHLQSEAAKVNGWQMGYVLDQGKSRGAFMRSDAAFRAQLAKLEKLSNDPEDKQAVA